MTLCRVSVERVVEFVDVGSGSKGSTATASKDHNSDRRIGGNRFAQVDEVAVGFEGDGVELVGAIQRDGGDRAVAVPGEVFGLALWSGCGGWLVHNVVLLHRNGAVGAAGPRVLELCCECAAEGTFWPCIMVMAAVCVKSLRGLVDGMQSETPSIEVSGECGRPVVFDPWLWFCAAHFVHMQFGVGCGYQLNVGAVHSGTVRLTAAGTDVANATAPSASSCFRDVFVCVGGPCRGRSS